MKKTIDKLFDDYTSASVGKNLSVESYIKGLHFEFVTDLTSENLKPLKGYLTKKKMSEQSFLIEDTSDNAVLPGFKIEILEKKTISCISPFNGEVCFSTKGLYKFFGNMHGGIPIFYYFFLDSDSNFFILITDSTKGVELSILCPKKLNVIILEKSASRKSKFYVNILLDLFQKKDAILAYIDSPKPVQVGLVVGVLNHWGHIFAQELPSFFYLLKSERYKIDYLIIGPRSFYNNPSELIHGISCDTDEKVIDFIIEKNILPFRPTATKFSYNEELNKFIKQQAISQSKTNFLLLEKEIKDFDLIIAIEIRANQRLPLNQESMYLKLINLLSERNLRVCFCFAGWTISDFGTSNEIDLLNIEKEQNIYKKISSQISSSVKTIDLIGCKTSLKILAACNLIDFHISSWGSGTAYFWEIGKKPGLVHGNRFCLKNHKNKPIISSSNRLKHLPELTFSDLEFVKDFYQGEEIRYEDDELMRNDYTVDEEHIVNYFINLIDNKIK